MPATSFLRAFLASLLLLCCSVDSVSGFFANGRWGFTVTDGSTGLTGNPATVTWSIVPDGTDIPGDPNDSRFIAFMDGIHGAGPGGSDLKQRPWFSLVEDTFNRWTDLSGLTFVYDPNNSGSLEADDGTQLNNFIGVLGTRGEIRLGGNYIDGPLGTNGMAGFLPDGDITIDTGDPAFFGNSTLNYRNFRRTLVHEIGHSLGLGHIDSFERLLMEPVTHPSLDGPQIDDIRGVHHLYGDALERGALGTNNTWQTSTDLGTILDGQSVSLGTDGNTSSTSVSGTQTDFVSINNLNDDDFFAFTITESSLLDVVLTPVGPTYSERISGSGNPFADTESASLSDLQFDVFGPSSGGGNPPLLASVSATGLGEAEILNDLFLAQPGEYYVQVHGAQNVVQLYQLDLSAEASGSPGDFDGNGMVDAKDFLLWQRNPSLGNIADWKANFPSLVGAVAGATFSVPEPSALGLLICALILAPLRKLG